MSRTRFCRFRVFADSAALVTGKTVLAFFVAATTKHFIIVIMKRRRSNLGD